MGSPTLALAQLTSPSSQAQLVIIVQKMTWKRDHIFYLEQLYGKQKRAGTKSELMGGWGAGQGHQDRRVISCTSRKENQDRNNSCSSGAQLHYMHLQASLCNS